jgi:hypothetical protein
VHQLVIPSPSSISMACALRLGGFGGKGEGEETSRGWGTRRADERRDRRGGEGRQGPNRTKRTGWL